MIDIFEIHGEMFAIASSELKEGWTDVIDDHDLIVGHAPTVREAVANAISFVNASKQYVDLELKEIFG